MQRLALVFVLAAGCHSVASSFKCTASSQCSRGGIPGTCQPTGYCSAADSSCASGQRYVDGLDEVCVSTSDLGVGDLSTSDSSASDLSTHTVDLGPLTTVSFTANSPAFGGSQVVRLHEDGDADTNYATDTTVEAFNWADGDQGTFMVRFLGITSAIPSNATVQSAQIQLYYTSSKAGSAPGYAVSAYRSLRTWIDTQATWNSYATSMPWQNGGGVGVLDKADTASTTAVVGDPAAPGYFTWPSSTSLVADVQAVVNGQANNGWVFVRSDAQTMTSRYFANENGTDGQRPILTVGYTTP